MIDLKVQVVIGAVATRVKVAEIADEALRILDLVVETFKHAENHPIPVASKVCPSFFTWRCRMKF